MNKAFDSAVSKLVAPLMKVGKDPRPTQVQWECVVDQHLLMRSQQKTLNGVFSHRLSNKDQTRIPLIYTSFVGVATLIWFLAVPGFATGRSKLPARKPAA